MQGLAPEFVFRHGGSASDWVDQHDRLRAEAQSFAYYERNQLDWWKQNKQIRDLFIDVEQEVRSSIKAGKIPSIRILSWVQLARRLSCDRATLKHDRRYHWINDRRLMLLTLIQQAREESKIVAEPAITKLSEMEQLKVSLQQQRTQTAIWYDKYLRLEQRYEELLRVLAVRKKQLWIDSSSDNHHLPN
ncbi:hypothetical protein GCM10027346_37520 [Hymenobacter seoulensis]